MNFYDQRREWSLNKDTSYFSNTHNVVRIFFAFLHIYIHFLQIFSKYINIRNLFISRFINTIYFLLQS